MPFTLTMPKLSPTMDEGAIAKWHKTVGDFVESGDLLLEISTDKATVEYQALDSGWLRQILVPEGQIAKLNQPIAIFTEGKTESIEGYQPKGISTETKKLEEKEQPSEGFAAKAEEAVAPPIKTAGSFHQPTFIPEKPLEKYEFEQSRATGAKRLAASPLARKLAQEKKLDLTTVKGTGPGNRIVSRDLEKAQPLGAVAFGRMETPQLSPGSYEEEVLKPMRKAIGQRLQEAKTFIPHFYVQQVIDAEALSATREQLMQMGIKASINDFIVRGCALALRQHPQINSGYHSVNQSIIRFKTIDIAVAVSVPEGLITPIIRHADFKNLGMLSVEIRVLAKRAREGKLDPQEYKGGSFTISNLGMYGVTDFQAIINPPQAAILAVSAIQDVPVLKNGAVVPGKTLSLTLSVDHRVIDGVAAAEFLQTLRKFLENPANLLVS